MDEKRIFVLDAVGAFLSVLLLGVVLPALYPWLGMPVEVLHWMALWPSVCLLYDVFCLKAADLCKPGWLLGIMVLNTSYCAVTSVLIGVHFEGLTTLGVVYFLAEIPVILGLVAFEYRIWRLAFPRGVASG